MPENAIGDTFFNSIKFFLLIGIFFCFIPLQTFNGNGEPYSTVKFHWFNWRTIANVFIIIVNFLFASCYFYMMIKDGFLIESFAKFGFFVNCFASFSLFLILARDWDVTVLENWNRIEKRINKLTCRKRINLKLKIVALYSTFLILAAVDYFSNVITQFFFTQDNRKEIQFGEYLYTFMRFPVFFKMTSYSISKALFIEFFYFIGSICWAYVDVFIMVNGIALSSKFEQISYKIEQYVEMEVADTTIWKTIREDYFELCILTKIVDKSISNLILLTSTNNFYYVLSQRFNGLKDSDDYGLKVWFVFSFILSVTRTACVYLFSASVNLESKKPLKCLYRIRHDIFNTDIERLIRFIGADTVYITGKNFFNIKRRTVLDITNALVTCQVVLVQYFANK